MPATGIIKYMKQSYRLPIRIFVIGTLIALMLVIVAFIFMNPPQCPSVNEQAYRGTCIVGANIGLGLMIMLAVAIEAMTLAATLAAVLARKFRQKIAETTKK